MNKNIYYFIHLILLNIMNSTNITNISKKKKAEFDEIFKLIDEENFFIDINLFRNLFESDFYEHFLSYIENKMDDKIKINPVIILHTNINLLSIQDTYHYDKIIQFAKILHKYTNNIKKFIFYGSSTLILYFIDLINKSLGSNLNNKIFYSNDDLFISESNSNSNSNSNKNIE